MKVKLLKKIRKRFEIHRYDELSSNPSEILLSVVARVGLPFYMVKDNQDAFRYSTKFFGTFEEARTELCQWILKEYGEKFRSKPAKVVKVWYNN